MTFYHHRHSGRTLSGCEGSLKGTGLLPTQLHDSVIMVLLPPSPTTLQPPLVKIVSPKWRIKPGMATALKLNIFAKSNSWQMRADNGCTVNIQLATSKMIRPSKQARKMTRGSRRTWMLAHFHSENKGETRAFIFFRVGWRSLALGMNLVKMIVKKYNILKEFWTY